MDNQMNFVKAVPGTSVTANLEDQKTALLLVQAACLLAQAGVTRLSAGELVEKISPDSTITLTPIQVGMFLIKLGLKKYQTHGKSRFALDPLQLETIRQTIAAQCEEQMQKLQSLEEKYKILPDKIRALQDDVKQLHLLESRQRELNQLIAENQPQLAKVNELERRWQNLQRESNRVIELEKACQVLTRKMAELPSLSARKTTLEEGLRACQDDEKLLAGKEAHLASSLSNLKERAAWVDLATIQNYIQLKKQELEQLTKQIDDKRSFLDKLLMRHREGDK